MGLIRGIIVMGIGVYAGIYVSQNYRLPKVDKPAELWHQAKEYLPKQTKDQDWFELIDRAVNKISKRDD